MAVITELTKLTEIDSEIGEVQAVPTANTVLDRLKQIQANTIATNNFTPLNSTNVDSSKADLDVIETQQIASVISTNLLLASMGLPVVAPVQYTFLDRLQSIINIENYRNIPFFNIQTSVIRPANVTAYTPNQQINTSTSVNNTIAFDFSSITGSASRNIQIDEITIINNGTSGTLATLNLYISETSTGNWNGKDATQPVFTTVATIGTMEVISPGILVKIPGDASNWNIVKAPITNLNIKMWLDASSKCYLCFTTTTAYTPVSNETFSFRIRGRFL